METFIIETDRANINAAGGRETLRFVVRAKDFGAAAGFINFAVVRPIDQGPHLEDLAKEHGIFDGGAAQL